MATTESPLVGYRSTLLSRVEIAKERWPSISRNHHNSITDRGRPPT